MSTPDNAKYTILVVDDNPDLRALIADSLTLLGHYTVVTAEDGITGLEQYYATHPHCVIIDVKMPGLDGYQLARALRGDPESAGTPLVILTALAQDKDRFAGLAAGVDQYLIKPVKPLDLVEAIRRSLAMSEQQREQNLEHLAGN